MDINHVGPMVVNGCSLVMSLWAIRTSRKARREREGDMGTQVVEWITRHTDQPLPSWQVDYIHKMYARRDAFNRVGRPR
jgi:hypothetical protein